jgi:hypothetical protein
MSTSPALAGTSSSASIATGSSAARAAAGSILPSATGACGSILSWREQGCGFFQPAPPPSPSRLRPLGLRVRRRNLLQAMEFCRQHTQH